jgi:hypothetical protein
MLFVASPFNATIALLTFERVCVYVCVSVLVCARACMCSDFADVFTNIFFSLLKCEHALR